MSSLILNPSNSGSGSVTLNIFGDDTEYNINLPKTNGTLVSFDADISPDSVATLSATNLALNRNILAEEAPKTIFRDFYGLKRELDKVQVELLICQINAAQNHIRELKYTFKDKIKNTIDNESLNAALDTCAYSTLDFSKLSEDGKPTVMPFEQVSTYVDRIDTCY